MLVIELKLLLFVCLLAAVGALLALPRLARWLGHRTGKRISADDVWQVAPLLEHAPFGLLLLKGTDSCLYANPYACRTLDLPPAPCRLLRTDWGLLLGEDRAAARREKAASIRYRSVSLPASHPDPAGTVLRWWVTPAGSHDLVYLLDVTTQHRAEEAGQSLLSDLSHELRTPLATILTHLEVLSLPTIAPEVARQSVKLLKAEAHRMARMIHLMLELGRLQTTAEVERRPVDLLELVEEVVGQVLPLARERSIDLSIEAEAPLPLSAGDADRLRQVFLNLLDNSAKFCRPGDRVVISLRQENAGILCTVHDSGPGIPPQHLPHLTRRFYRAAPQEVEGSGLGLALTEEILHRHGSRLEIESHTEGERTGTTVRFLLPALSADHQVAAEGVRPWLAR